MYKETFRVVLFHSPASHLKVKHKECWHHCCSWWSWLGTRMPTSCWSGRSKVMTWSTAMWTSTCCF